MESIPYDKRSGKIWFDGKPVNWPDVKIHVLSHGLHYASCVFEGERVYDGEIFKLEEHTERLFHSASRMGFKIPYKQELLNKATKDIVAIQKIKNGYVRPVAWRGSEMMAISAQQTKINVAIAAWEWGPYYDINKGIRLNISKWKRPAPDTIPWDTKASGLYMICTLSKHEAEREGFTDSLMLDYQGNVIAWYKAQQLAHGLVVPIATENSIILDCIDRVDAEKQRFRTNVYGWFYLTESDNQGAEKTKVTAFNLLKPTKKVMTAACAGHCWQNSRKVQPVIPSLRELLLSCSINWRNFKQPIATNN